MIMESSERGPLCSVLEEATKMSNRNSRSKKPDATSVTRKWNTRHYTRAMGEKLKQSNDFLNGLYKTGHKIKTHT